MENDTSFERVLDPSPGKRKRSSILRPPDKRGRRDSRTVSFNDCCMYKELHQDGTCDMTNLFLRDDMDLTMMDIVEPCAPVQIENAMPDIHHHNDHEKSIDLSVSMTDITPTTLDSQSQQQHQQQPHSQQSLRQTSIPDKSSQQSSQGRDLTHHTHETYNNSTQMDLTLMSQFMQECNHIETPIADYDATKLYDKRMSVASDMSGISSLGSSSTLANTTMNSSSKTLADESVSTNEKTLIAQPKDNTTTMLNDCSMSRISEISSFNNTSLAIDQSINQTFYGAFHDSNDISMLSRRTSSGMGSLMQNIEALDECVLKVDQLSEESMKKLDDEIEDLFKFYRHVVNENNKYEFAVAIFGLRYSLWLIFNINPETYPNEKLSIKFAVNKKDRHLYPFAEFSEAVRRTTKEGRDGYLTKFIFNCQKFRRFLRKIGYRKPK